jgi:dTMP kinase
VVAPVYVALEGPEGCGKSTQAALLAAAIDAVLTRETGGTAVGARIRDILHDASVTDLVDEAEALLAAADRAQHLRTVVLPALRSGRHVVSDRSVYSTLAYQGYGRGLDLAQLGQVNRWAIADRWPDLVVLLDVDVAVLDERLRGRDLDRFELAGHPFHERVRRGFHELAAAEPERWVVVDGNGPTEAIAVAVRAALRDRLGR